MKSGTNRIPPRRLGCLIDLPIRHPLRFPLVRRLGSSHGRQRAPPAVFQCLYVGTPAVFLLPLVQEEEVGVELLHRGSPGIPPDLGGVELCHPP